MVFCSCLSTASISLRFFLPGKNEFVICEGEHTEDGHPTNCTGNLFWQTQHCTCVSFQCSSDCDCTNCALGPFIRHTTPVGPIANCTLHGCTDAPANNTVLATIIAAFCALPVALALRQIFAWLHSPYFDMLYHEARIHNELISDRARTAVKPNPEKSRRPEKEIDAIVLHAIQPDGDKPPADNCKSGQAEQHSLIDVQRDRSGIWDLPPLNPGMVWYTTRDGKHVQMKPELRKMAMDSLRKTGVEVAPQLDDAASRSAVVSALPFVFSLLVACACAGVVAADVSDLTAERLIQWARTAGFSLLLQIFLLEPLQLTLGTSLIAYCCREQTGSNESAHVHNKARTGKLRKAARKVVQMNSTLSLLQDHLLREVVERFQKEQSAKLAMTQHAQLQLAGVASRDGLKLQHQRQWDLLKRRMSEVHTDMEKVSNDEHEKFQMMESNSRAESGGDFLAVDSSNSLMDDYVEAAAHLEEKLEVETHPDQVSRLPLPTACAGACEHSHARARALTFPAALSVCWFCQAHVTNIRKAKTAAMAMKVVSVERFLRAHAKHVRRTANVRSGPTLLT
jgi:hypothetical protein